MLRRGCPSRAGDPEGGGRPLAESPRRPAQHATGEKLALQEIPYFIDRAHALYGYTDFVADTGGSLIEVIDHASAKDPVLKVLTESTALLYIRGTPEHAEELIERFRHQPKPMYYQPGFLERKWAEYKAVTGTSADDDVDPDDFLVWGFGQLLHHRIPLYEAIARQYGYAVDMQRIPEIGDHQAFLDMICEVLDEP